MDERNSGRGTGEGRGRDDSKWRREEDEQEAQERRQQEGDEEGRPRRKPAREVRYGEEKKGREEQGAVREGVTVYGPHKVRGKWRRYVGTVEEMIEQQDRTGHVTRAVIVQWEDQGGADEEGLSYPAERSQVCPQGREMKYTGSPFRSKRQENWKVKRCRRGGRTRSGSDNQRSGGRPTRRRKAPGEGREEGAMGKENARLKAGKCERMGRAGGNA